MKPQDLALVLEKTILAKQPLLISGPPGVGKTDIIEQVTKKLNYELILMLPSISEGVDFKGFPVYNPDDGAHFVPFDTLKLLIDATEPTIAFLDDLGQANTSTQAACMNLFRSRLIGEKPISDHITFVIATNGANHHAGSLGVLEPIKSRMISIVELTVDVEDWVLWALQNEIRPEVIAFMRLRGNDLLSAFKPTTALVNTPSPRAQEAVSKIINLELPNDIEAEMIKGAAGEAYAVEMRGFLSLFRNLPDPEQILRNPDDIDIPENNPMVLFAYCGALASMASPDRMDAIVTFAKRLPVEFQIKLLQYDCKNTNPGNHETAAYTDWAIENQNMMVAV